MSGLSYERTIAFAFLVTWGTLTIGFLRVLYTRFLRPRWHMRHIPRPSGGSFLRGDKRLMETKAPGWILGEQFRKLGPVIRTDASLSMARFVTMDKRALHHILISHPLEFPKSTMLKRMLGRIAGEGLLTAEGATHARQRKVMNPSFGAPHLKTVFPLFMDKANQLRDVLLQHSSTSPSPVNIYDYANRATLDVISAAGFGHDAQAIQLGANSPLYNAFNDMFGTMIGGNLIRLLTRLYPVLSFLTSRSAFSVALARAQEEMRRLSEGVLREAKASLSSEKVTTNDIAGRDLLTALVRSNMASDLAPQYRMSDEEVMAQMSTFLVAGNDTTANAVCWALFGLCSRPNTQQALRNELLAFPSDAPTYDELNSLPYLDAVIMETLRFFSPVSGTTRNVSKDCVIPLSKPFVDTQGVVRHDVFLAKNTVIYIPIAASNLDPDVWGSDALEFRPERWLTSSSTEDGKSRLPDGARDLPSTVMPIFLAGPRSCIGWRFSVLELKTLLFSLIRSFEFELAVPADEIESVSNVVSRPRVKSRRAEGWQLPMLIKPIEESGI